MRALALGILLLIAAPATPVALAACPLNDLEYGGHGFGGLVTNASAADPEDVIKYAACHACYSWPLGYFRITQPTYNDWGLGITARARYRLAGPPSSEPIEIVARLLVTGTATGVASALGGIGEGATPTNTLEIPGGETKSNVPLEVTLSRMPGEEFDLCVRVGAGSIGPSYTSADVWGALEFDLLSGYSLQLCQDYEVPVNPMTWGRLRALYR